MKNLKMNSLKYVRVILFLSGMSLFFFSCNKEKEPAPQGRLIFYTQLDPKEYDAIDIYVNKKYVGKLTVSANKRPDCNDIPLGNMVSVDLPAGEFMWSAKQYMGGKEIDEWYERSETLKANDCDHIKLVE